jgi:hypothetical protein
MGIAVFAKSRSWMACTAVGLLTMASSIETARAAYFLDETQLAGRFSGNASGYRTICVDAQNGLPVKCSPTSVSVQLNVAEVIEGKRSKDGRQFCLTLTDVSSPLGGSKDAAVVTNYVVAGSTRPSYNGQTAKGWRT